MAVLYNLADYGSTTKVRGGGGGQGAGNASSPIKHDILTRRWSAAQKAEHISKGSVLAPYAGGWSLKRLFLYQLEKVMPTGKYCIYFTR